MTASLALRALGLAAGAFLALSPAAHALYGDDFGAAPINGHPEAVQAAPAYPGDYAVWAGACDRGIAPAPGSPVDMGELGGFGQMPADILAPTGRFTSGGFTDTEQVPVPAPRIPDQCIDYGAGTAYGSYQGGTDRIWQEIPWSVPPYGQSTPVGDFAPLWRLPAATAAGAHPDGTTTMFWQRNTDGIGAPPGKPDGSVDNIVVKLPPGFFGDPTAVPHCTGDQFAERPLRCPPQTQVGVIRLALESVCTAGPPCNLGGSLDVIHPVYNLEPRDGYVAELGFGYAGTEAAVRIGAKARTNGDFGVTAFAGQIPAALVPISQSITIWGVPWAASNDLWRAPTTLFPSVSGCSVQPGTQVGTTTNYIPPGGLADGVPPFDCQQHYDPSWGPIKPFFTSQTECDGANVTTTVNMDSYQHPGAFTSEGDPDLSDPDWKTYAIDSPPVTGCEKLPFDPDASFTPTSTAADSASGLDVDIDVPQNDTPPVGVESDPEAAEQHWRSDAGLAASQLDKTVVTLPVGMSVNPSGATGLRACSDAQMGVTEVGNPYRFNNQEPTCPDGSYLGTVEATTPALEGSPNLTGEMVLGSPKSTVPASGEMFRLFLILRNEERGILAKVHGTSTADPATGQVTAVFDKNPRVPVENIKVRVKGGDRGVLATPQSCGEKVIASEFTPWTAAHNAGGVAKDISDPFTVGGDCSNRFAPALESGMDTRSARGNGSFSFRFTRSDGQQYLRGLTATLPKGLLASVKDVPLCSNAAADTGSCPAGSKIGVVDAKAGAGDPFVLEEKGEVFLTEGYKGGPYGLAVKIRPVAGPFRGNMELSPIIVRQKIDVDRTTAQVSAVSDPFPLIHHGVPLRVREVTVVVNRDKFMLNPSGCAEKQVTGRFASDQGTGSDAANRFQASGCSALAFKPKLSLRLTGRKQVTTGKHPGIRAQVTQAGVPEAGIEKAIVRLPKSLALDVNNAQALCEFADGIKPDLENHCPKGSIVGRARAVSPLLNDPLVGNVYFVKNIRIDPKTGNQIRTLPMIVVALRGEIAVNLKGESDTQKGKLVNTFASVPDAPVSQFNLNIAGGKDGIIAVTRTRRSLINLCAAGRQIAEADMDGHNRRTHDRDITMAKPCTRAQTRAAKRKAAKQAKRAAKRAKT